MWKIRLLALAAAWIAGCAIVPSPEVTRDLDIRACTAWFSELDVAVDRAGVRDAEAHRMAGFPYLRSNRRLASLAGEAIGDDAKFAAWLTALRELDRSGRSVEARNLPAAERARFLAGDWAGLQEHSDRCAQALMGNMDAIRAGLATAATVPDNYSILARTIGLYPLTSVSFLAGVERWQAETRELFRLTPTVPASRESLIRYLPPGGISHDLVAATLLATAPRDGLGPLARDARQAEVLLQAYAPVIEIESQSTDDTPGALHWLSDGQLDVDAGSPAAYRRIDRMRIDGNWFTQLVYTYWFNNRPPTGSADLLAGHLDGLVIRITIDSQSVPILMDSIHACGCFHQFFPSSRLQLRASPPERGEWAFVPAALPVLPEDGRYVLRLSSGNHYLMQVSVTQGEPIDWHGAGPVALGPRRKHYTLLDDGELRTLPTPSGGSKSIYGPDGLIAGTERGERWLFWPMGIASAGAMRQWGHHATAFVGRRHFDDADLLDKRFRLMP